jgi:hypothetical protein
VDFGSHWEGQQRGIPAIYWVIQQWNKRYDKPEPKKTPKKTVKSVEREVYKQWVIQPAKYACVCQYCDTTVRGKAVTAVDKDIIVYHRDCWEKHYRLDSAKLEEA